MRQNYLATRQAHYEKFLGRIDTVAHWEGEGPPHVDVFRIAPRKGRPFWTLVTSGMSDRSFTVPAKFRRKVASRIELLMYSRKLDDSLCTALRDLSLLPFDRDTFFHEYHTAHFDHHVTTEPSLLTAVLLRGASREPVEFQTLKLGRSNVRFLEVTLITEAERQYAIQHGSEGLEHLLLRHRVSSIARSARRSVV